MIPLPADDGRPPSRPSRSMRQAHACCTELSIVYGAWWRLGYIRPTAHNDLELPPPAGSDDACRACGHFPTRVHDDRIAVVACARTYAQLCITFHDSAARLRRSGNCCARFSSGHIEPDRRLGAADANVSEAAGCAQITYSRASVGLSGRPGTGVTGEASQDGRDLIEERGGVPGPGRCVAPRAGWPRLLRCPGEPVHLGPGHEYLGLERRPGGRRDHRRRLIH